MNPIQSNVNKRAQVFLFARIFYNITFTYKLKHLRFQLTRNKNCKEQNDVGHDHISHIEETDAGFARPVYLRKATIKL